MILNINNEIIEVQIERTKRVTLSLQLREDASVLVKAPLQISDGKIQEILEKKANWIVEKREEIKRRQSKRIKREFVTGATLPFLGKEHYLRVSLAKKSSVDFNDYESNYMERGFYISTKSLDHDDIQKLLKKWYKKRTLEEVNYRVREYSKIMNVTVSSVSVKSRKREWGSCDSHGNLTFNWKLSMATPEAIDYVVVHELCHRKFMDHSKQFWKEVEKYIPNYKEQKKWLNENSINMNLE